MATAWPTGQAQMRGWKWQHEVEMTLKLVVQSAPDDMAAATLAVALNSGVAGEERAFRELCERLAAESGLCATLSTGRASGAVRFCRCQTSRGPHERRDCHAESGTRPEVVTGASPSASSPDTCGPESRVREPQRMSEARFGSLPSRQPRHSGSGSLTLAPVAHAARSAGSNDTSPPRYRDVLIVEDEPTLRRVVARNLSSRGVSVREAATAEAAVRAACERRPDLLLLDLNLPDGTGWDVLRQLRRRGLEVPTIVVSAVQVRRDRLEEFRPLAYLPKPFPIEALLRHVLRADHESASDVSASPGGGHDA